MRETNEEVIVRLDTTSAVECYSPTDVDCQVSLLLYELVLLVLLLLYELLLLLSGWTQPVLPTAAHQRMSTRSEEQLRGHSSAHGC